MFEKLKSFVGRRNEKTFTAETTKEYKNNSFGGHLRGLSSTPEQRFKKAVDLARQFITVLGLSKKIRLDFSGDKNCTDGQTIVLETAVFKDETIDAGLQTDVFVGLTIHECSHVLYTDFPTVKTIFTDKKDSLLHSIWNVLEDEYIETELVSDYPGYASFLAATKKYKFETTYKQAIPDESKLNNVQTFFNYFLRMVRYPTLLDDIDEKKWGEILEKMQAILDPYPHNTKECINCANKIYDLLKQEFKKEVEEQAKKDKAMQQLLNDIKNNVQQMQKALEEAMSEGHLMEAVLADIPSSLDESKAGEEDLKSKIMVIKSTTVVQSSKFKHELKQMLQQLMLTDYACGDDPTAVFYKAESDIRHYKESRNNVHRYASSIKQLLQRNHRDTKLAYKNMRSGSLDTSKLAEARQGVQTVHERFGMLRSKKVCVGMLLDLSGSMRGSMGYSGTQKYEACRDTAVLFAEALRDNPDTELYIYGHTTGETSLGSGVESTDMYIFKEPGYAPQYALGSITAHNSNRDGLAILETAKRIRKFTDKHCILFVVSDGAPAAQGYGGDPATRDVKQKVTKVTAMGFTVIHIAIETHVPSEKMFKHYFKFTDAQSLPRSLGGLMRTIVDKHTQSEIIG